MGDFTFEQALLDKMGKDAATFFQYYRSQRPMMLQVWMKGVTAQQFIDLDPIAKNLPDNLRQHQRQLFLTDVIRQIIDSQPDITPEQKHEVNMFLATAIGEYAALQDDNADIKRDRE